MRPLDEIRTLTNLIRNGEPRGATALGRRSRCWRNVSPARNSNRSVNDWSARCYLESFQRRETEQYIHVRIDAVGGQGAEIFPPETCSSVYKATDGVPRLINQVCDHVLLLAYAGGQSADRAAEGRRGLGRSAAIAHALERAKAER